MLSRELPRNGSPGRRGRSEEVWPIQGTSRLDHGVTSIDSPGLNSGLDVGE